MVGAVLVAPGAEPEVIGEGWHRRYGSLHAEREALADCERRGRDARGATLYVSLEPCAHTGRQPPCVEAILGAGIARVVIASDDPSEKTSGVGPRLLREAGVEVAFAAEAGGEEIAERARDLNQPFRKHALTGRPYVIYKAAASLDGRTAAASGDSKWISGEKSRELVHRWRAEYDAIAVGIGTALADDPLLTARPPSEAPAATLAGGDEAAEEGPAAMRQPLRIVFDSEARLPLDSQLVRSLDEAPLLVIVGPGAGSERVDELLEAGVRVFVTGLSYEPERLAEVAAAPPRVDLAEALDELGARGVTSLLLEGGAHLAGAMAAADLIDEMRLFVAPLLLGAGPAPLEHEGVASPAAAPRAESLTAEPVGDDMLITARLRRW